MRIVVFLLLAVAFFLLLFYLWQKKVLSHFAVTTYDIKSEKLSDHVTLCVLSDLHGHVYGEENKPLIEAVRRENPNFILCLGDNIVVEEKETFPVTARLMKTLTEIAPVYMVNGNHEMKSEYTDTRFHDDYMALKSEMEGAGVRFVNNRSVTVTVGMSELTLFGLDLPVSYYRRFGREKLTVDTIYGMLGEEPKRGRYNILLAHNPEFGEAYAAADFDLALCGHYHGGLICLPKVGSIISPSFRLFPPFAFGDTMAYNTHIITSRGLGTHRYNVRVNNPAELVVVHLRGV